MDHDMMLTSSSAATPSSLEEHGRSNSPNALAALKHAVINNNNTEDFLGSEVHHSKMKEAYGMYGSAADNNEMDADGDADDYNSSDRIYGDTNGEYNGEDSGDNEGMVVIKPLDNSDIGMSPAQSLLRGASKRKALKPCSGGRRKQQKPTRFYFDYDPTEGEPGELPPRGAAGERMGEEEVRRSLGNPAAMPTDFSGYHANLNNHHRQNGLDNDSSPPPPPPPHHPSTHPFSSLSEHVLGKLPTREAVGERGGGRESEVDMERMRRRAEENGRGSPGDSFPTKYHQLGNQLMQHQETVLTITPEEPGVGGQERMGEEGDDGERAREIARERLVQRSTSAGPRTPSDDHMPEPGERPRFSPSSSHGEASNHSGELLPGPDGSIKSGSRIFHPDAYCELCNREFCNKYFLKTHKANKHGIYENSTSPTGQVQPPGHLPMPPVPNGFPDFAMHPLEGMPPVSLPSSMAAMASMPLSLPLSSSESPPKYSSPQSSVSSSLANIKQENHHSNHSSNPHINPPSNSSLSSELSRLPIPPSPGPKPPGIGSSSNNKNEKSMEDYCEICQKHFCNKYYLKKHKHDVHGIVPSVPTQKRSRTTPLCSSSGAPTSITPNSINTSTAASLGIPHSPGGSNGLPPGMPANMAAMANVMFINPFTPPVFLHTQPMLQGAPGGFLPNGVPGMPPQVPPPQVPPPTSEAQSSPQKLSRPPSSSPHSTSGNNSSISLPGEPNHRPPPLPPTGAPLNADAYCELCRKEFCNRYFLKIHKANKHGIFIDDDPSEGGSSRPPSSSAASPDAKNSSVGPWEASRASPSSETSSTTDRIESASKGDEIYCCKVCNKDFHSKESLRIHNINVHGFSKGDEMKQLDMDMALAAKMAAASGGIEAGELVGPHVPPHPPLPPPPFALEGLMAKNMGLPHMPPISDASKLGTTMFGNMIAAKLADRVMCDICNKEVCNKYFLKTHKLKVHGIQPDTDPKEKEKQRRIEDQNKSPSHPLVSPNSNGPADLSTKPRDSDSGSNHNGSNMPSVTSSPSQPSQMGHQPPNTPNMSEIKRPNDQELLKMGIDPEAYCEICKKEFCSKYFLKTHKQNIHGIKIENSTPREHKSHHRDSHRDITSLQDRLQTSLSSLPSHMTPGMVPSMNMAPTMVPALRPGITNGQPPQGPPAPPPGMMPNLFNFHLMPEHPDLAEKRSWQWKEPINATRVMCEMCNKELCNKYFLRTHMLNKHGLHWDHVTGQTTPAKPGMNASSSQNSPESSKPSSASNTPTSTPPIDTKAAVVTSSFNPMIPNPGMFDMKAPLTPNGGLMFPMDPLAMHHHHQQQQRSGVIVSKDGATHREPEGPESKHIAKTPKSEPDLPTTANENHPGHLQQTVTAKLWQVPSCGTENGPGGEYKNSRDGHNFFPHHNGPKIESISEQDKENMKMSRPEMPNGAFGGETGSILDTESTYKKCTLCGMLFGDSLSLRMHKVQDHGLQLSSSSSSENPKAHLSYEAIQDARYVTAMATYSLKKKYQNNMKRKFRASRRWRRLGQNMGVIGDKVKSAIMNHIANHQKRKKFRCAHCQERFLSKPLWLAHLRSEHPKVQTENDTGKSKLLSKQGEIADKNCSGDDIKRSNDEDNQMDTSEAKDDGAACTKDPSATELPVSYATPTNATGPASPKAADAPPPYLMQPFTVQENAGEHNNFATSIVYLPVMQKVSEPVTVTFKLTPAEQ